MRRERERNEIEKTYNSDELGICGESEWKRYGRAVVREGLVDDGPDLHIVGGCRWANWDD